MTAEVQGKERDICCMVKEDKEKLMNYIFLLETK